MPYPFICAYVLIVSAFGLLLAVPTLAISGFHKSNPTLSVEILGQGKIGFQLYIFSWGYASNGHVATYQDWAPSSGAYNGGNCAHFWKHHSAKPYTWADIPCHYKLRFLCEKK
jgi:hypothetical protein